MWIWPRGTRDVRSVRIRQQDFCGDTDHFGIFEVIELSLLCAVDADLPAGVDSGEYIGRKKTDRLNIWAGLGRLQVEDVLVHELWERIIVPLAEEVSLADGGVGERCVE